SRNASQSPSAPITNGNFSHVIRSKIGLHFLCGFMGDFPNGGSTVSLPLTDQTKQIIQNSEACLEIAGSSLDKVVSRRIYMIDMKEFREVDRLWVQWFKKPFPVSTCAQVRRLAKEGARIKIEVVAEE
ncbi:YjgF-like protein, partial [Acephala macrosclerotiorum]